MAGQKELMLTQTHSSLNKLLQAKASALPKDFNQTRFLQNCMTVLQDTQGIEKTDPLSNARCLLKGAFLGLDFFNRECYAIPYGNTLTFLTDYRGDVKLAKKYSINPIKDIYAKLVREGDTFENGVKDGQQYVNFVPLAFNDKPIVGAFAVCLFEDGSMICETMSSAEIEKTRKDYSKVANGPAWTKSPGEMYKKTVLKRICKLISLSFDNVEQKKTYEESSDMEFKSDEKVTASSSPLETTEYTVKDADEKAVNVPTVEIKNDDVEQMDFKDTAFEGK
jgi:recombination protein RecT